MTIASAEIPVLQSERLRLRALTSADFPHTFAIWSDPTVVSYLGGKPSTKQEAWARLLRNIGHWHAMGFGYWAVERTSDGAYVGEVGLADFRRDISPSLDGIPEIGWVIAPHAQNNGLAFEAATIALAWRDKWLPAGETVCIISPENKPSLRIAEKLGFGPPSKASYRDTTTLLFRRVTN